MQLKMSTQRISETFFDSENFIIESEKISEDKELKVKNRRSKLKRKSSEPDNFSPSKKAKNPECSQRNQHGLVFPDKKQEFDFNMNDFKFNRVLYACRNVVKSLVHKPSGRHVAIKVVNMPKTLYDFRQQMEEEKKCLLKEVEILRALSGSPHIVTFYGACIHEGHYLICMEQMDLSLKDLIPPIHRNNNRGHFLEDFLCNIIKSVIEAQTFCQRHKIMHRDIKPTKILFNRNGEVKLCDFGESQIIKNSLSSTYMETMAYWTPEKFIELEEQKYENETSDSNESDTDSVDVYSLGVLLSETYGKRSVKSEKILDKLVESNLLAAIWSFGITILEVAHGKLPFFDDFVFDENNNHENIIALQHCIRNVVASDLVEKCLPSTHYSDALRKFVSMCLEKVENRPDFEALKNTEFYQVCVSDDTIVSQQKMAKFIAEIEKQEKSQQSEQQEKIEFRLKKSRSKKPNHTELYKLYKQRYNTMKQINEKNEKIIQELQQKLDHIEWHPYAND